MDYIQTTFEDIGWITGAIEIKIMTEVMMGISITLLVFLVMKQLLTVYILETSGDPDGDPMQLFVKASISLALITSQSFIFEQIMKAATLLSNELTGSLSVEIDRVPTAMEVLLGGITSAFMCLIIFIMIIILMVKAAWRAIEIAFFRVLFPLFCVDLVSSGNEHFRKFISSYLITSFGYIIQIVCLQLSLNIFLKVEETFEFFSTLQSLVLLLFAIKLPNWLKEFAYSSGLGGSAARGASTAANLAMQASRLIKV